MPISVNMLGLRFTNEAHMRSKNGHPAHRTTGALSSISAQACTAGGKRWARGLPGRTSDMARAKTGTVRARPTQNRRRMSASSGFSGSSRVTVRGSSAMPQIGQLPGWLADDLGMHGADVFRLRRHRRRRGLGDGREVPGGVRLELLPAGHRAEVVGPAGMLDASRRGRGDHGHAANRVDLPRTIGPDGKGHGALVGVSHF